VPLLEKDGGLARVDLRDKLAGMGSEGAGCSTGSIVRVQRNCGTAQAFSGAGPAVALVVMVVDAIMNRIRPDHAHRRTRPRCNQPSAA
jgi:hypothetical protein